MYAKHINDKVLLRRSQSHYITLRHKTSADGVLPKSVPYSAIDRFPKQLCDHEPTAIKVPSPCILVSLLSFA